MRVVVAFFAAVLLGSAPVRGALAQRGLVAPQITVQTVEPLRASAGEQRFRINLLIDNPNTEPLGIRNIEFKLRLADEGIIDGYLPAPVLVEALHQQTMTLELGSEIISSLSRLMSFVEGPENMLAYEIYGTITLDRKRRDPFRFSARGEAPLVLTDQR
jgi:LEA14-like dessication related protein